MSHKLKTDKIAASDYKGIHSSFLQFIIDA